MSTQGFLFRMHRLIRWGMAIALSTWIWAGQPAPVPEKEPFTMVVIPDSQFMVCRYQGGVPSQFIHQICWVKSHLDDLRVKMVSHLGDICDCSDDPVQWNAAKAALAGLEEVVPFGLAHGNHDYGKFNPDRSLRYDKRFLDLGFHASFPISRFAGKSWFGGSYPEGVLDNNYVLFSGGGMDFIVLHLGDLPDAGALKWASAVLDRYPTRRAIVCTHSYMGTEVYSRAPGTIWNDVVKSHDNVILVLCGHDNTRESLIATANDQGHQVYQILSDYQIDNPQRATLRYYTFFPAEKKIRAYTVSTVTGEYERDAKGQFEIPLR